MDPDRTVRCNIETDMTRLEIVCINCGQRSVFMCRTRGFNQWQKGKLIQDALPMLSDDQRELMISQICPTCFELISKEQEYS